MAKEYTNEDKSFSNADKVENIVLFGDFRENINQNEYQILGRYNQCIDKRICIIEYSEYNYNIDGTKNL